MTYVLIRGLGIGAILSGLAACATSPAYPIAKAAPAAAPRPAPPPTVAQVPPPTSSAPAPESVTSQPLPPTPGSQDAPPPPPTSEQAREAPPPPPPRPEPVRMVATGKVVPATGMYRDYVVRKGDHLDAIARDLQSTRADLVEANHLKSPDSLRPGQHLRVPIDKAYVAAPGDTLAAVAKRFDVSAEDLADLNVLSERSRLRAGDRLALPAVIHDRGPVPAPTVRLADRAPPGYHSPWVPSGRPLTPIAPPAGPPAPSLSDSEVTAAARGRFVWPVRGDILASFGVHDEGRRNDGVDVRAPMGASVRAAAAGDVVYAGDQVPGFGNLVLVKHADGWVTAYAHLEKVTVKMRQTVAQNEEIGQVGDSGGAAEPELHFEVRYAASPAEKAKPVDPLLVLPK